MARGRRLRVMGWGIKRTLGHSFRLSFVKWLRNWDYIHQALGWVLEYRNMKELPGGAVVGVGSIVVYQ